MPIILFVLGCWIALKLADWLDKRIPDIEPPAWFLRLRCKLLGHKWEHAGWAPYTDDMHLIHKWWCKRCGEYSERLEVLTWVEIGTMFSAEMQERTEQKP